jgi:hypothetical protein
MKPYLYLYGPHTLSCHRLPVNFQQSEFSLQKEPVPFIRCSSHSSMSEEHLMGLSVSVCLSVAFFTTVGPEVPFFNLLLHNNGIQGFLLCKNGPGGLLLEQIVVQQ